MMATEVKDAVKSAACVHVDKSVRTAFVKNKSYGNTVKYGRLQGLCSRPIAVHEDANTAVSVWCSSAGGDGIRWCTRTCHNQGDTEKHSASSSQLWYMPDIKALPNSAVASSHMPRITAVTPAGSMATLVPVKNPSIMPYRPALNTSVEQFCPPKRSGLWH